MLEEMKSKYDTPIQSWTWRSLNHNLEILGISFSASVTSKSPLYKWIAFFIQTISLSCMQRGTVLLV